MHDPLSQLLPQIVRGLPKIVSATPWYVILIFAVGLAMAALKPTRPRRRHRGRRWSPPSRGSFFAAAPKPATVAPSRKPDAADQLRSVMAAGFTAKPLLNRSESFVLKALEPLVGELLPGWRVMAQVSLGEVLDSKDAEAFNAINAKRVDFLLVDDEFRPRLVVEYQGQGHHQGSAAARDAVKKEALRRAGVGYGEVLPSDTVADLQVMLRKWCPCRVSEAAAG